MIAFAGDANENVFRNEAEYVGKLFGKRFGAEGRVLVLENSARTDTWPLATLTNLSWAIDDIAKKMDPAEDVLVYIDDGSTITGSSSISTRCRSTRSGPTISPMR